MVTRSKFRGHEIYYDERRNQWLFNDGVSISEGVKDRPCYHCGLPSTLEGHDGCLGILPGVQNACCGHGEVTRAYVQFVDGTIIREQAAKEHCDQHEEKP